MCYKCVLSAPPPGSGQTRIPPSAQQQLLALGILLGFCFTVEGHLFGLLHLPPLSEVELMTVNCSCCLEICWHELANFKEVSGTQAYSLCGKKK